MKLASSTAAVIFVAAGLPGCATNAGVDTTSRPGVNATASAPHHYDLAMANLQRATDALRASTHAMAGEPAGPRRNQAIRQAHAAIINADKAMSQLYRPGMGTPRAAEAAVGTTLDVGAGGIVGGAAYPQNDVEYTRAMEKLHKAVDHFRESIIAMSRLPTGPQRDQAIKEAQQALFDTNQAMIQLPPDMRTERP